MKRQEDKKAQHIPEFRKSGSLDERVMVGRDKVGEERKAGSCYIKSKGEPTKGFKLPRIVLLSVLW